jgi:1-acyl-sn-glycerol-3-phosphate acyltransferase
MIRWLAYKATVWALRAPTLPFTRIRLHHGERSRIAGPCILAPNHISHFDPPILATLIRRHIAWMTTAGLLRARFAGGWLRAIGCFPVDRERTDRASVRTTLELLARGKMVGIFPEGGIRDGAGSILGGAAPLAGLGALAQMSGAPILPCVILGTDRLYARRSWRPFFRTVLHVGFAEPLRADGDGKAARTALEHRYCEAMRALLREMVAHFHLADDDLPQSARRRMAR